MQENYSQEDLDTFKKAFDLIDVDGNKQLDKEEFQRFLNLIGLGSVFSAELLFIIYDENDNDLLSFDEFLRFLTKDSKLQSMEQFFAKVFKKLDKDNSGTLDADELVEFVRICKIPIDLEELRAGLKAQNFKPLTFSEFIDSFLPK
jgi:Ca2+-binding EF-hand superfamily protein